MADSNIQDNQISEERIHELQYKRNNGEALTQDENRFLDNLEQGKVGLTPTADMVKNLEARKRNGEVLTPEEEAQLSRAAKGSAPEERTNKGTATGFAVPGPDNSSGPKDSGPAGKKGQK